MLVLIPARAGSKRLVGKNLRELGGRPLIAHTITCARTAFPDQPVWVSTDSREIADAAIEAGAEVPFLRSPELATDTANSVDVALDALDRFSSASEAASDLLMLLQPTSPFRTPQSLVRAVHLLESSPDADAVVGVTAAKVPSSHLYYARERTPLVQVACETEAERVVVPNGAVYVVRTKALRSSRSFYPKRTLGLEMDLIESVDIDTPDDYLLARGIAATAPERLPR